jgi:gamma-glutamyltranspeptidase/glutathione hydrolase
VFKATAALALAASALATVPSRGADSQPGAGPVRDPYERPLVTGCHGVVTTLHPLSSMAGMRILMEGGNAFDAAIAAAVATTVVDPKDSSIGGHGFATLYVARERRVRALNFYGTAPRAATMEALKDRDYTTGYLSTPVPSNLKGYEMLHRAYGSLPWSKVLEPAIELARDGFVVTDEFTEILKHERKAMDYPTTRRVYFPNGRVPLPGEIFRQPDLARTLQRVASEGAEVFYEGDIARGIAEFFKANGGLIAYEDLAGYRAKWVEPISTTYRGYTVYTQPPNSSGIAVLLQLNLLEGFDLRALGHNSPAYLHLIGEVQRLAIADRNRYVADPDYVSVPVSRLLSKAYAAERRRLISAEATMPAVPAPGQSGPPDQQNTTHLSVADADGNLVALTQTLGAWFGSGVVVGDTGVIFSDEMRHLHTDPKSPSRIAPGRRPRSNQSPVIVLKDGQPFLALGTPGSDAIWQRIPQVLVNLIDFGMDIQRAVSEPRMIYGAYQETGVEIPPIFNVEDRVPGKTVEALRALGFRVKVVGSDGGSMNGVMRDPSTGFLYGGADPRRMEGSEAWFGPAHSVYAIGW